MSNARAEARIRPAQPLPSGPLATNHPHGKELGTAAVSVAERDPGTVNLMLAGLAAHLHRGLGKAQHS